MANLRSTLGLGICASLLLAVLAGCQQQPLVSALPQPNFNAPQVAEQPHPAPVLPKIAVVPPPPQPAPVHPRLPSTAIPTAWVPTAPARQWRWIVIHHSATPAGGAAAFDKMHKAKGWDELGYDFVIGNGTDTADGQVEVGPRWTKQKWGAHAKTPDNRFNEFGIGICLVGNFDVERPTPAQMHALAKLTAYLMKTYRVSISNVIGHGETKATDCPGRNMNVAEVRR